MLVKTIPLTHTGPRLGGVCCTLAAGWEGLLLWPLELLPRLQESLPPSRLVKTPSSVKSSLLPLPLQPPWPLALCLGTWFHSLGT